MEKDKIFFGETGITSTSANHISNIAKEYTETINNTITGIRLYTTQAELLDGGEPKILSIGEDITYTNFDYFLNETAQANSLIAWLREAIRAKENLTKEVYAQTDYYICEQLGIELPQPPKPVQRITEDDYIATLPLKQRNRYYQIGAYCAVYGKFIHPNGEFAMARKNLNDVIRKPNQINGAGKETIIYTYTPTSKSQDVEDVFFKLQEKYRNYQAELNKMKYDIETAVNKHNADESARFQAEQAIYISKQTEICEKVTQWKKDEAEKIMNLKIIIPDALKETYNQINNLKKN